jgi:Fe-S-cluster containining protein
VKELIRIREEVEQRAAAIAGGGAEWPCRKGCDECCRRLAAVPRVSGPEWRAMAAALDALSADIAELARRRIRESAGAARPVTCPMLDRDAGTCLVYAARPVECRAYGFYAEREGVLGCALILAMAEAPNVVWGNHAALEEGLRELGPAAALDECLAADEGKLR